nr:unnamed protein product [Callosobruchus analis]
MTYQDALSLPSTPHRIQLRSDSANEVKKLKQPAAKSRKKSLEEAVRNDMEDGLEVI